MADSFFYTASWGDVVAASIVDQAAGTCAAIRVTTEKDYDTGFPNGWRDATDEEAAMFLEIASADLRTEIRRR